MVWFQGGIWYHMPMETSGSGEWIKRPEYDHNNPAMVFDYARLKQRWINERVNEHQRAEAIEQLAEELEYHITESFDTLPELTITARDVSYTKNIEYHTDKITVELAPLPLEGDAEIFGEHALQGRLFGFHQGSEGDLRVYLSTGDAPRQLMGGIYTPLLSVSIDSAEIRLSEEDTTKQQYELKRYIAEQAQEYDQDTRTRIAVLYSLIEEKTGGPVSVISVGPDREQTLIRKNIFA